MGLLDRIQKATITIKSRINPADYKAMLELEEARQFLVSDYNANKKHLADMEATYIETKPDYIEGSLAMINFSEVNSKLESTYIYKFVDLIKKVEAYFNGAYGLNKQMARHYKEAQDRYYSRHSKSPSCMEVKDIWETVELFLSMLGGLNLVEGSEQKLMDDFKSKVGYRTNYIAKGKTLKLDTSWFSVDNVDWRDSSLGYCIDARYTQLKMLYRAITFFETGFISVDEALEHLPYESKEVIPYTKKQVIDGLEKVNGITFYKKNNSVKLSFKTEANITKFVEFFKLNELEKSRW